MGEHAAAQTAAQTAEQTAEQTAGRQPYTAPPQSIRAAADALVRMRSDGHRNLDTLPDFSQGFWLRDSATALTAAGPLLEAAALRCPATRGWPVGELQ